MTSWAASKSVTSRVPPLPFNGESGGNATGPSLLRRIEHHIIAFIVNRPTTPKGASMDLKPGDKTPNFKLATDGDGEITRSSLKGQPFVLYFYPKDDTSGCTKEAIDFSKAAKKFDGLGIPVIGVSKDSTASHDKFKAKHKLKLTLGSDPETQVAKDFGVWVEKSMYGRKYMGMERATFLVDGKGVIHQIWRKVKVLGHAEAVLAAAKSL
jgi:peroxiredoxin